VTAGRSGAIGFPGDHWTPCQLCPEVFEAAGQPDRPRSIDVRAAKRLCRDCPIVLRCAEWAIANGETWGIWGGLTPRQRTVKRRLRGEADDPALAEAAV
jgi:WhiB family redox-sensing transcriptional regulator